MDSYKYLINTPWDAQVFGINTFEISHTSELVLEQVLRQIIIDNKPGHYTVKVAPLISKKVLHQSGFYYCDTLLEPYCKSEDLIDYSQEGIALSTDVKIDELIEICHGAFIHGRFHRDFNLDKSLADLRYDLWLKQIYAERSVFALMYNDKLAGFWGFFANKIVLHALSQEYRGKGMAKYFWSLACQELFRAGYSEVISSISASNVAALNLYSSLGFKFRNPVDVYHLLIK
jgi:hypothetical protein